MANKGTIKLGPWGGAGGVAWDYNPGSSTAISQIVISHGHVVDSVSFESIDRVTGKVVSSGKYGGFGGNSVAISLDGTKEYLTLISGTILDYVGSVVVQSLTFHTNLTTYGPFGYITSSGSAFEIPMEDGEIVGFFGRAGGYLDTLGIYVIPSANSAK